MVLPSYFPVMLTSSLETPSAAAVNFWSFFNLSPAEWENSTIPAISGTSGAAFAVQLPGGATVTVPPGFDSDERFILLTVVREASQ